MSIYYVPGTILGTRDTTIRQRKIPALWSFDSSADILGIFSYILLDTILVMPMCYSICECCIGYCYVWNISWEEENIWKKIIYIYTSPLKNMFFKKGTSLRKKMYLNISCNNPCEILTAYLELQS